MADEMGNVNRSPNNELAKPEKREKAYYVILALQTLAAAVGAEMDKPKQAVYLAALSTYSTTAIEAGIKATIAQWEKSIIPPVGFIIARIREYHTDMQRRQVEANSKKLVDMVSAGPPGWGGDRRREAQRIYLQSCAEGKWGLDRVESAKELLRRFDAGQEVAAPGNIAEVLKLAASNFKMPAVRRENGYQREPGEEG